jgi:hypothetical protein
MPPDRLEEARPGADPSAVPADGTTFGNPPSRLGTSVSYY